jgi:hypothetical protein
MMLLWPQVRFSQQAQWAWSFRRATRGRIWRGTFAYGLLYAEETQMLVVQLCPALNTLRRAEVRICIS